jgi:hypothetical protein
MVILAFYRSFCAFLAASFVASDTISFGKRYVQVAIHIRIIVDMCLIIIFVLYLFVVMVDESKPPKSPKR